MSSTYLDNRQMQDPAVPIIHLPMKFKSRRSNTAVQNESVPEGYYVDILDVEGCGCVRHIWFLYAEDRRIEITVDGAETPQVNMPLKAFFGIMHDWTPYYVDNAAYTVLPNYETPEMPGNPGYNLWLPIPFARSCQIRIHLAAAPQDRGVYTAVDWHEYRAGDLETPFRFHAEHHRYAPAPPRNCAYSLAEIDGSGFLAGVVLGVRQRNYSDMIYHTGGMSILIDGESDPHLIRGTNMEDDFGFSWGFHPKQTRWIGSPYHKWGGRTDQDGVIYRFFGHDPIAFDSSLSFRCGSREDEVETVAYYYQIPGTRPAPLWTPQEWLLTGFYEQGDDWDTFNTREAVEDLPLDDWIAHFGVSQHFIRIVPANRGWLDFRFSGIDPALPASHFTNRSIYAGSALESKRAEQVVIRLGFDDWLILWVNGEQITVQQSEGRFELIRIPVALKKGRNEFLIKTNNLGHCWNAWVTNFVLETSS